SHIDRLYLSFREVAMLDGSADTCDSIKGTVKVSTIAGKAAIDDDVLGCKHDSASTPPGDDCSTAEIEALNTFQPTFQLESGSSFTMRRLAGGAGCEDVRALLP